MTKREAQKMKEIRDRHRKMAQNERRIWQGTMTDDEWLQSDRTELVDQIAWDIHFAEGLDLDTCITIAWDLI